MFLKGCAIYIKMRTGSTSIFFLMFDACPMIIGGGWSFDLDVIECKQSKITLEQVEFRAYIEI